jgi:hypothetical protein
MTTFHQQLRSALPSSLISVAPTAWAYGSTFGSANSAFCKLQAAAGNTIDWYNIQFYNGFEGTWNTCENVFWNSDNSAFLSLKQITDMCGIPLSKAAIGKLWSTSQLAHDTPDQVPSPEILGGCIAQAGSQFGYPGTGIMIWVAEMGNWVSRVREG